MYFTSLKSSLLAQTCVNCWNRMYSDGPTVYSLLVSLDGEVWYPRQTLSYKLWLNVVSLTVGVRHISSTSWWRTHMSDAGPRVSLHWKHGRSTDANTRTTSLKEYLVTRQPVDLRVIGLMKSNTVILFYQVLKTII